MGWQLSPKVWSPPAASNSPNTVHQTLTLPCLKPFSGVHCRSKFPNPASCPQARGTWFILSNPGPLGHSARALWSTACHRHTKFPPQNLVLFLESLRYYLPASVPPFTQVSASVHLPPRVPISHSLCPRPACFLPNTLRTASCHVLSFFVDLFLVCLSHWDASSVWARIGLTAVSSAAVRRPGTW